jgi:DNA-binding transcriptional MerR regulator
MGNLVIPDKLYFRIGEVSRLLKLEPYVLRFWEKEFPTLTPTKGANGRRMYRKKDVEMVVAIKKLLYEEGFTIAGAKKVLTGARPQDFPSELFPLKNGEKKSSKGAKVAQSPTNGLSPDKLIQLKGELRDILTILNRRC